MDFFKIDFVAFQTLKKIDGRIFILFFFEFTSISSHGQFKMHFIACLATFMIELLKKGQFLFSILFNFLFYLN